MEQCPYCDPPWPHEHVGDVHLPLLLIVRDVAQRKEVYFHGTMAQCAAIVKRTEMSWDWVERHERFEQLLLETRGIGKALEKSDG